MAKKSILFVQLCVLLLFGGCLGDNSTVEVSATYEGETFSIGILNDWRIIEPSQFVSDMPRETLVAFTDVTDPEKNISVIKEKLVNGVSAFDYATANIVNAEKKVVNYELIQIEEVTISEQNTKIHVFKGRLSAQNRLLKFVQIYFVKNHEGYVITGVTAPDASEDLVTGYKEIMRTFVFK